MISPQHRNFNGKVKNWLSGVHIKPSLIEGIATDWCVFPSLLQIDIEGGGVLLFFSDEKLDCVIQKHFVHQRGLMLRS